MTAQQTAPIKPPLDFNTHSASNVADAPGWFESFCQKQVLSMLSQMPKGHLTLHLPNHQAMFFGQAGLESESFLRAEITVNRPDFFVKLVLSGHIGAGESYMDGDWDSPDVAAAIAWFIINFEHAGLMEGSPKQKRMVNLMGWVNKFLHAVNHNSIKNSAKNIAEHYDLSNDFFALFLDPSMTYSSAKFVSESTTLEEAQTAKIEALCQKLHLRPQDHVLEIGSGWGAWSIYAAQKYGCRVTTITLSQEQFELANERIKAVGLEDKITVLKTDYRHVQGEFDKIVSVEMLEAVGEAYFDKFFQVCHDRLKPGGLMALQVITCPDSRYALLRDNVDFIQKHIFPGSLLPSLGRLNEAANRTGDFFLHDLEDLGNDYARTLSMWFDNFNQQLDGIKRLGFDSRFIRKWRYYLKYCEAAFATRNITVIQAVYTRPNNLCLSHTYGGTNP